MKEKKDFPLSAAKCNTDSSRGPSKTQQQSQPSYFDTLSLLLIIIHTVVHSYIYSDTCFLCNIPLSFYPPFLFSLLVLHNSLMLGFAGLCLAYCVWFLCTFGLDTPNIAPHPTLVSSLLKYITVDASNISLLSAECT